MRKPDFFIVGAPKCGTTALQYYLSQHPDIFMPKAKPPDFKGKELHFFGSDLNIRKAKNKSEYLSYFKNAKNEKRVGEASVWYLYSTRAAYEIKEFSPTASIIIMLRNPVDMLYSLHSQLLYNNDENIADFGLALKAEADRKVGKQMPSAERLPVQCLFYREIAKFTEQVKRYFDVFKQENVHVIIFDDFKQNTTGVYQKTLRFLGVDDSFKPEFKIINPNKVVRSQSLKDFLGNPSPAIRKIGKCLMPKRLRQHIIKSLWQINIKYTPRPPMNPKLRHQLQEEFSSEVEKLSKLLKRDLSFWTKEQIRKL